MEKARNEFRALGNNFQNLNIPLQEGVLKERIIDPSTN